MEAKIRDAVDSRVLKTAPGLNALIDKIEAETPMGKVAVYSSFRYVDGEWRVLVRYMEDPR